MTRDAFDMFELQHADEKRARLEEAKRLNTERAEQDAREEAERKESLLKFSKIGHRRQLLAQYREAGVEPPLVTEDGTPRVSLTMLLSIGWTIAEVFGEKMLVRPPVDPQETMPRRKREDYEQST